MTPERWQRAKQIFESVIECAPEERERLLQTACEEDPSMRAEVESLIAAHDQPWDFIESPTFDPAALRSIEQRQFADGATIDHYRVLSHLGAGGMGEVYLAVDTRLDRRAAIKLLPPRFTQDQDRVRRFIQEARAASALNHPNIITIYDIGRTSGTHYIGTEFVDGETMRLRMSSGRMEAREAIDIALQIAGALAAAHSAGIVHRDIKPENVMVRRDGYVKVLDFGLAKLTPSIERDEGDSPFMRPETVSGAIMGTVAYMSPEQARGLKVDARSDIFSLGVVLYEMLAGCAPFTGQTAADTMVAILEREPEPLVRYGPSTPPELQRIVDRMLGKRREDRYQSINELVPDLSRVKREMDSVVGSRGLQQPEASNEVSVLSGTRSLSGWVGRHRLAILIGVLVAVVLVSLSYLTKDNGSQPVINSIAVLPFENTGGDDGMEYLSDGITESLINSLSQISQLRVIARTTVFAYKGQQPDLARVGRDLSVDAVLTGKVTRHGETLTIQADLVQVGSGAQLWGDRYQRPVKELMSVQEGIARDISDRLRFKLSGEEQQRLAKRQTDNTEAYHLYLKGRHHNSKRTEQSFRKALECFQEAIDLDPNYARAYAGMADTYALLGNFSFDRPSDVRSKAEAAVNKALELDPALVEALGARAYLNIWSNDWEAVERDARRAIELNANYPGVRYDYGLYLALVGRSEEAALQYARAQELDPLSATRSYGVARSFYWAHQYDAAIREFQQTLELDRDYWLAHFFQSFCYRYKGEMDRAITEGVKGVSLSGRHQAAVGALGMAFAAAGRRDEARALLDELIKRSKQSYVAGYYIAQICLALGKKDEAFVWLERLSEEGYSMLPYVKVDPNWDPLRRDPRYERLMRKIGLSP